ncbi:GatB/YqeY domain-containing protein, partial [Acinetobacter baumannii]
MLQSMIKQRRESIAMFQQGGRTDLAEKEAGEIAIIEEFLPRQLGEEEVRVIAAKVIADVGAAGPKDMGKVMAAMKSAYAGQIDFA